MPNRLIKESIRTSKSINSLSDFNFRLWAYLITYVDDYGRGSADPEILKGFVFPRRKSVTESSIAKGLTDLAATGLINLYEVDGESYLCFPTWAEHQRIQQKRSKFPAPEEGNGISPLVTVSHRESPPESNPNPIRIQNPNTNPNPESNVREIDFDCFWSAYPKKVGKADARKAFVKVKVSIDILLSAIEQQKRSKQWRTDGGRFIPNPSTWLNQCRWEDELPEAESGNVFLDIAREEGIL